MTGVLVIFYVMYTWWRDGARKSEIWRKSSQRAGGTHLWDALYGSSLRAANQDTKHIFHRVGATPTTYSPK